MKTYTLTTFDDLVDDFKEASLYGSFPVQAAVTVAGFDRLVESSPPGLKVPGARPF